MDSKDVELPKGPEQDQISVLRLTLIGMFILLVLRAQLNNYITALIALAELISRARSRADSQVRAVKVAKRLHNLRTIQFLSQEKHLRKARKSLAVSIPAARLLSMDKVESELETLASAALSRNRHARNTSGRLLAVMTALLPAAARTRRREEWLVDCTLCPHVAAGRASPRIPCSPSCGWP
jgi:hypothetical protein